MEDPDATDLLVVVAGDRVQVEVVVDPEPRPGHTGARIPATSRGAVGAVTAGGAEPALTAGGATQPTLARLAALTAVPPFPLLAPQAAGTPIPLLALQRLEPRRLGALEPGCLRELERGPPVRTGHADPVVSGEPGQAPRPRVALLAGNALLAAFALEATLTLPTLRTVAALLALDA